ncbi:MAG: hypothetical protein ACLVL7_14935 [Anaerotruncus massiliensis (ex Togo et al. 2019)]
MISAPQRALPRRPAGRRARVDLYTPARRAAPNPPPVSSRETDACKVSFSDLPAVEDAGGQVTSFEDTVWVLLLNGHKEPLANTNIRQAVAYSVNRSLFEGRLPGNLRAADTLVPPAILWQGESFRARAGEKGPLVSSPDLAKRCYVAGREDLGLSALPLGGCSSAGQQPAGAGRIRQQGPALPRTLRRAERPAAGGGPRTGAGAISTRPSCPSRHLFLPDALLSLFRSARELGRLFRFRRAARFGLHPQRC